ncbi:MAG: zinc-ribbon domain-containing protein [Clostridia bacterium]|nr:zinc-ribbon domain-containing protein [Clostridia bacterium]
MAFMENASLRFKRMQNINALNSEAAKLEKANAELFSKLGIAYFEKHFNAPEGEFAGFVNEIIGNNANIKRMRAEAQWLKSMLTCRNCGADLKENQQFCPSCGTKVEREMPRGFDPDAPTPVPTHVPAQPAAPAGAPSVCANCGGKLVPGAAFCAACGTPAPRSSAPAGDSVICPKCGKQLRAGAKFCSGCGNVVN